MATEVSNEDKHAISCAFSEALTAMDRGQMSLEEVLTLVNDTAAAFPGGERQQRFYTAFRELARKASEVVSTGDRNNEPHR